MRRLVAGLAAVVLLAGLAAAPAAAAAGWDRFEIILWHNHGPAALAAARRLGVTAGMLLGVRGDGPDAALAETLAARVVPLRDAGLGLYVENIATDYYAAYHRWRPDLPETWQLDIARARHQADPADRSVFCRSPGLSDPAALARITARLTAHVRTLGHAPLYYSLADEAGIADLAAAWDFDLSPASLAAMRDWLRGQYGTLAALNSEWGTGFASWDAVLPLTTDAALAVQDGNFAAWADFKAWMDVAFARAVRAGADAMHAADPLARAGLEGAQDPGWGGYDYTLLADTVDVMEVTGDAPTQALAETFNPSLVTLSTAAGASPAVLHGLWRAALAGSRGVVVWDPDARIAAADGTPGPDGLAFAGVFASLRGTLGARLLASVPQPGAVAVLYSPASFRTGWLLDRQAGAGGDWSLRLAEQELTGNAWRDALRQAGSNLAHLGIAPQWLSPALLTGGALRREGLRALILPQALALSDAEVAEIRAFAAAGGLVLADIPPGGYDAHSRRRAVPPLAVAVTLLPGLPRAALGARLAAAGIAPGFTLTLADGAPAADVTVQLRRDGAATLFGIQRDLPPGGDPAGRETVTLAFAAPVRVQDLRQGGPAVRTGRVELQLDPVIPAVLAIAPAP